MEYMPGSATVSRITRDRKKMLIVLIIVALIVLVGVLEAKRRVVQEQLEQVTVRLEQLQGNTQQNREQAQRVVRKVRKLMLLDEDIDPTVATIVDVNALRERNPFYNRAENGDFLVVTPTRAILYDEERNIILDVVPVQIQPAQPAPPAAERGE